MKRLLLIVFLAAPLSAQTTATVFLTSQHNTGSGTFSIEGQNLTIDFEDSTGFGASVSRSHGRWSGELAVFRTSSSGSLRSGGTSVFSLGDLELMPITAMVRYEFGRVYVGGGAAYVITSDLETDDGDVAIDSEIAPVIGGGFTYDFSSRWGLAVDVRYIPLSIGGRPAPDEDRIEADVDPLLASVGLRLRF